VLVVVAAVDDDKEVVAVAVDDEEEEDVGCGCVGDDAATDANELVELEDGRVVAGPTMSKPCGSSSDTKVRKLVALKSVTAPPRPTATVLARLRSPAAAAAPELLPAVALAVVAVEVAAALERADGVEDLGVEVTEKAAELGGAVVTVFDRS